MVSPDACTALSSLSKASAGDGKTKLEQQAQQRNGISQDYLDNDNSTSGTQTASKLPMGTRVEDIRCGKGADNRIEGFVGKGQFLRGPLYAGELSPPAREAFAN